jgi:long-chain acyl-CoA synthetase
MIKTSGINVSPAEIEAFLAEDDRVAESVVLGVPDTVRGEAVVAVVRVAPGAALTAADVEDLCRHALASYKVPREVHVVEEMPQTDTGKVSRRRLLDLVLAADTGGRP